MDKRMGEYKADWDEARHRMEDWWSGRPIDRVPAYIEAPRAGVARRPTRAVVPDKYINADAVFHNVDIRLESTFWGAEAFPHHGVYMGPMFCCAYLGCEPVFEARTTWYTRPFSTLDELEQLEFDRTNPWWQLVQAITRQSVERAQGRYLTCSGDGIGAVFDLFAELIGTETTLIAMLEEPERVRVVRDRMLAWGQETREAIGRVLQPYQEGGIDGMQVWAPGPVGSTQCDMCVMISPAMFRDLVVEEMRSFFETVDYGIYHLDGEEQIKHLDALLEIDALKMIQFVPVTKPSDAVPRDPLKWTDLYRRIIESGRKALIYTPPDADRIATLLNRIPREGAFLHVTGCPDEHTARSVISVLERVGV